MRWREKLLSDEVKFWFEDHSALVGIGAASLILAVVMGTFFYFTTPVATAETTTGTVQAMGAGQTETGSYPRAVVQLPDRQVTLRLRQGTNCTVGSTIAIERRRAKVGDVYVAAARECRPR